jgi:hypothetical protein
MLHVALVVSAFAFAASAFLEWSVGDAGAKAAKDRLADWYVYIGDGGLATVVKSAAESTEDFISHLLGPRLFSVRAVAVWFLITEVVAGPLMATAFNAFSPPGSHIIGFNTSDIGDIAFGIAMLFPFDYICLMISRLLFRRIAKQPDLMLVIAYIGYAYGVFAVSCFGASAWVSYFWEGAQPAELIRTAFLNALWPTLFLRIPLATALLVPMLLSTVFFIAVILGALLMQTLRPVLQPLLCKLIERVASMRKNVLTVITGGLAALTALLDAVEKVSSPPH